MKQKKLSCDDCGGQFKKFCTGCEFDRQAQIATEKQVRKAEKYNKRNHLNGQ